MRSTDLSRDQVEHLLKIVEGHQRFLFRFLKRIDETGWPHDDRLRHDVKRAFDAVMSLRMALHYMACDRARKGSATDNDYDYRQKRKG